MAKKKTAGARPVTSEQTKAAAPARRRTTTRTSRAGDASPAGAGLSATSEEVQAVAHDTKMSTEAANPPSYDDIARAAYRRYLDRGGAHGQDFDDWVAAERELRQGGSR